MDNERPVRVGVVGLGNFARSQHLPNISRMPDAQLVAVCDTNRKVLDTVATEYGVPHRYGDARQLLECNEVEAVVLTVRDDLQASMAVDAVRAGKHVYVEKPLSASPEECLRVADAVAGSDRRLAVGYNKRFAPIYRAAREILRENGGVGSIHLAMTDDAWRWAKNYPPGHLMTLDVCHLVDLIEWFSESPIKTVYCRSSRPEEDMLLVETLSGCVASIMFSGNDSMDSPKEYARLIGDRWSLTAEDYVELHVHGLAGHPHSYRFSGHLQGPTPFLHRRLMEKQGIAGWRDIRRIAWELFTEHRDSHATGLETPFIPNFIRGQGWYDSLQSFLQSIRSGALTDHVSAGDAFRIARVMYGALESRRTGAVVAVDDP